MFDLLAGFARCTRDTLAKNEATSKRIQALWSLQRVHFVSVYTCSRHKTSSWNHACVLSGVHKFGVYFLQQCNWYGKEGWIVLTTMS